LGGWKTKGEGGDSNTKTKEGEKFAGLLPGLQRRKNVTKKKTTHKRGPTGKFGLLKWGEKCGTVGGEKGGKNWTKPG